MEVKVKKLNSAAILPRRGSAQAAGYDLFACLPEEGEIVLQPGETRRIPLGLALALPEGTFGAVFARSGLATRQGLRPANCVGVVDSDYRGGLPGGGRAGRDRAGRGGIRQYREMMLRAWCRLAV